jgi:hypothetical protein
MGCVVRSRYHLGKHALNYALTAVMLPTSSGFTCNCNRLFSCSRKNSYLTESRLASCASCELQTPLVNSFYLNISYGRFYVNFHPKGEAENRPIKKKLEKLVKSQQSKVLSQQSRILSLQVIDCQFWIMDFKFWMKFF